MSLKDEILKEREAQGKQPSKKELARQKMLEAKNKEILEKQELQKQKAEFESKLKNNEVPQEWTKQYGKIKDKIKSDLLGDKKTFFIDVKLTANQKELLSPFGSEKYFTKWVEKKLVDDGFNFTKAYFEEKKMYSASSDDYKRYNEARQRAARDAERGGIDDALKKVKLMESKLILHEFYITVKGHLTNSRFKVFFAKLGKGLKGFWKGFKGPLYVILVLAIIFVLLYFPTVKEFISGIFAK